MLTRWIGVGGLGLFVALSVGSGCSSSSTPGGGNNSGGTIGSLCQKLTGYVQQCQPSSACATAELAECSTLFSQFSAGALTIIDGCVTSPYSCPNDAGQDPQNECVTAGVLTLTPTAAQTQLKTDFCAKCPDGASKFNPTTCSGFFATTDAGPSFGQAILEFNDALASQLDQQCTGAILTTPGDSGINDCELNFVTCAEGPLLAAIVEPAACFGDAGSGITGKAFRPTLVAP